MFRGHLGKSISFVLQTFNKLFQGSLHDLVIKIPPNIIQVWKVKAAIKHKT